MTHLKKQLDVPADHVQTTDGQERQTEMIGQQDQRLAGRLGRSEWRPGKQRHTLVDGCRVERIGRSIPVDVKRCVNIEFAGLCDQALGEVGIDLSVAFGVGISQGGMADWLPAPHVIELAGLGGKADLGVAQAHPIGQLSERYGSIVLSARQRPDVGVSLVALEDAAKAAPGQKVH